MFTAPRHITREGKGGEEKGREGKRRDGKEGKGREGREWKEGKEGNEGKGTGCQSWCPAPSWFPVLEPQGRSGASPGAPSPGALGLGQVPQDWWQPWRPRTVRVH